MHADVGGGALRLLLLDYVDADVCGSFRYLLSLTECPVTQFHCLIDCLLLRDAVFDPALAEQGRLSHK
jgi:hypothetical protein